MTVLELFRDYLHITRIPSRSFFEKLIWFNLVNRILLLVIKMLHLKFL